MYKLLRDYIKNHRHLTTGPWVITGKCYDTILKWMGIQTRNNEDVMKYGIFIEKLRADDDKTIATFWYHDHTTGQLRLFDTREAAQEYINKDMETFIDPSGARHTAEVREYR